MKWAALAFLALFGCKQKAENAGFRRYSLGQLLELAAWPPTMKTVDGGVAIQAVDGGWSDALPEGWYGVPTPDGGSVSIQVGPGNVVKAWEMVPE